MRPELHPNSLCRNVCRFLSSCAALFTLVYICASEKHKLHLPDTLLKKILGYVEQKLFKSAETSDFIYNCPHNRTYSALRHSVLLLNIPPKTHFS
jgi:hypothetical protein